MWKKALRWVKPEMAASFMSMDPHAALAKSVLQFAGGAFKNHSARRDEEDLLKRSGLYYLLQLQEFQLDRMS